MILKHLNHSTRRIACLAICCAALVTTGCASSVNYGAANILSEPSGAEIINLKDDSNLGKTPAQVVWKGAAGSSEQVTVQLRKNGYQPAITTLWINKRHASEDEALIDAVDVHTELQKE